MGSRTPQPPNRNQDAAPEPRDSAAGPPAADAPPSAATQVDKFLSNSADFFQQFAKVLTGIAALIGAVGVVFGEGQVRIIAVAAVIAGVLGVAWLISVASRGPRSPYRTDLSPDRSGFRGLIPFQEGDALPRREQECTLLYTIVTDRDFRVGILYGEPDCGKTSLLRAGFVPRLVGRPEKRWTPLYVVAPSEGGPDVVQQLIRDELENALGLSDPAVQLEVLLARGAKKDGPIVVICDQFEQFFLGRQSREERAPFMTWVAKCVADEHLPVRFVFALQRGFEALAYELEGYLGRTLRGQDQLTLRRFSPDQARDVLQDLAATDRVALTPGLRAAVVRHLTFNESVCPAELQVVGRWLKDRDIRTEAAYEGVGRVHGLLRAYLTEEMTALGRQSAVAFIARLLAGRPGTDPAPIARDRIVEAAQAEPDSTATTPSGLEQALQRLMQDGLVVQDVDYRYRLVHDYFGRAVREAADGRIRKRERLLWRLRQAGVAYGATATAGVLAAAVALVASAVTLASSGPREFETLSYPAGLAPNDELVAFSSDGTRFAVHYAGTTLFWNGHSGDLGTSPVPISQPFAKGFVPLSLEFKPDDNHLSIVAVHAGLRQWSVSTVDLATGKVASTPPGSLLANVDLAKCELHTAYGSPTSGAAVAYACQGLDSPIDLLVDSTTASIASRTLPRGTDYEGCLPAQVGFTTDARLMAAYGCNTGSAGSIKMRVWTAAGEPAQSIQPPIAGDPKGLMTGPTGHPMLALKTLTAAELWDVQDVNAPRRVSWLPINDFSNPHPVGLSANGRFLAQQLAEAPPNQPFEVGLYEMGHWFGPINVPSLLPAIIGPNAALATDR